MLKLINDNRKIILFNLATFVILALIVEGLIYVGLRNPSIIPDAILPVFRRYYQYSDRQIIQVSSCGRYDRELFYMLKPGTCVFENREFRVTNEINSLGLRDDESSLESPEVIFLGDSYTLGWGVPGDDAFPSVIETRIGRKVLNAGMSSFGTAREMILLDRLPTDKTEILVIQFHPNDHEENEKFIANGYSLPIRTEFSYDSLASAIQRRQRYFLFKHLYGISKNLGQQLFAGVRGQKGAATVAEEAELFLKILSGRRDKLENKQIFAFKTNDFDKLEDKFADAVDSLARKNEYEWLNITTVRINNVLDEDDYFTLDDHINSSGHRKIADIIHNKLVNP